MFALLTIPWFLPGPIFGVVHWFGLMVAISIFVGWHVSHWYAARHQLKLLEADRLLGGGLMAGFVACYFLNGLVYFPDRFMDVLSHPMRLFDRNYYLGLSSFGGFLGCFLAGLFWKWRTKLSLALYGDSALFALPFGWFFGRMGCFLAHDHMGMVTNSALGVRWPVELSRNLEVVGTCLPEPGVTISQLVDAGVCTWQVRHDMGFYEVLWSLAASLLMLFLVQKRRWPGFYMVVVPLLYTPVRFLLDFYRSGIGDDPRTYGLVPSQYACVVFFVAAAIAAFVLKKDRKPVS